MKNVETMLFSLHLSYTSQEIEGGMRPSFSHSEEILDEMITRSRGEVKHMKSPKVSSSTTTTPSRDLKGLNSPRLSEKGYSPRISELRQERSPRLGRRASFSPGSGEIRLSKLGEGSRESTPQQ